MSDEDFLKPYRKLQAVEENQAQNDLLDTYLRLYKEKYKEEFIVPRDKVHYRRIKELRDSTGHKALGILFAYFEMQDEWFNKQHHSLDCLLKNINKISQFASKKTQREAMKGKLKVPFSCDACWKEFELICDASFDYTNKLVRCPLCEKENKPLKRVTKREMKSALGLIGKAFPEIPVAGEW